MRKMSTRNIQTSWYLAVKLKTWILVPMQFSNIFSFAFQEWRQILTSNINATARRWNKIVFNTWLKTFIKNTKLVVMESEIFGYFHVHCSMLSSMHQIFRLNLLILWYHMVSFWCNWISVPYETRKCSCT